MTRRERTGLVGNAKSIVIGEGQQGSRKGAEARRERELRVRAARREDRYHTDGYVIEFTIAVSFLEYPEACGVEGLLVVMEGGVSGVRWSPFGDRGKRGTNKKHL